MRKNKQHSHISREKLLRDFRIARLAIHGLGHPDWDHRLASGRTLKIGHILEKRIASALHPHPQAGSILTTGPDAGISDASFITKSNASSWSYPQPLHATGKEVFLEFQDNDSAVAKYVPYNKGKFNPQIQYKTTSSPSWASIVSKRIHEGVHALQYTQCAALHCTNNGKSRFLVHPEDMVRLKVFIEYDAFARQAALSHEVFQDLSAKISAKTGKEKPPYEDRFSKIYHAVRLGEPPENLRNVLNEAAHLVMENMTVNPDCILKEHYEDKMVRYCGIYTPVKVGTSRPRQIVRLDPSDYWDVGAHAIGPNLLGDSPAKAGYPDYQITADGLKTVREASRALGFYPREHYPTLSAALSGIGMSKRDFLAAVLGNTLDQTPAALTSCPSPSRQ